jgi:cell shape-determining protein MreC
VSAEQKPGRQEPKAAPFSAWSDQFSPWIQALEELKNENDQLRAQLAETKRHLKAALETIERSLGQTIVFEP